MNVFYTRPDKGDQSNKNRASRYMALERVFRQDIIGKEVKGGFPTMKQQRIFNLGLCALVLGFGLSACFGSKEEEAAPPADAVEQVAPPAEAPPAEAPVAPPAETAPDAPAESH